MKLKGKINNFEFDFEGEIDDFIKILNNLPEDNSYINPIPYVPENPSYPNDPLYPNNPWVPNDPWYPYSPITICKRNYETTTGDSTKKKTNNNYKKE